MGAEGLVSRKFESDGGSCRIALYSHDTMGLGHMRRNLLIAQALANSDLKPTILMIAGARELERFRLPDNVDCLTLPAYYKDTDGNYKSQRLDLSRAHLTRLRAKTIRAAVKSFAPDILIVDNVAQGALGELDATLEYLRGKADADCVLGLRDIQDDGAVAHAEFRKAAHTILLYYNDIWVYGDPVVYDIVKECGLPSAIGSKVRYTGYLDQRCRIKLAYNSTAEAVAPALRSERIALCMIGGGQDGARLAEAFVQVELPFGWGGVLITGPYLPDESKRLVHQRARLARSLCVHEFVPEPAALIERADRVITMGGYNSVCEALSFDKRTLVVPRVKPRQEQWLRAQRLREFDLVDVLHPDDVTPEAIRSWLESEDGMLPRVREKIDWNGLLALPRLVNGLLINRQSDAYA